MPHVRPETWPEIRDLIVRIAGPNRSFQPHEPYSQAHFDRVGGFLPGIERYSNHFLRHRDRGGAALLSLGIGAAGGLLRTRQARSAQRLRTARARDAARAASSASARGLNVILIGALETVTDDYGRIEHQLQAEGQRVPREIPGIVDIVVTMNWLDFGDGKPAQRGFICTSRIRGVTRQKTESGSLEQLEPPDLGALIAKVLPPRANHGAAAAQSAQAQPLRQSTSASKEENNS